MAKRIIPLDREVALPENELVVSKTDPLGNITYCNRAFMRIAGYSEKELLKKQHTIIRHPDMPRGIYRHLWQTLEKGQEYFGYIKNLSSSGAYYWLFTHIVPDRDHEGTLQSYFSVQRKPLRAETIARIEPIYKEMLAIEKKENSNKAPDISLAHMHQRLKEFSTDYEHFALHV